MKKSNLKLGKAILAISILMVLFLTFGLIIGCTTKKDEDTKKETDEKAEVKTIEEGKLKVGMDTAYPPFENKEGDEFVGFDVDMATEIADRLDLELELVSTAWDGIFEALKAKKFDMVMSAVTITDDRRKSMDFSDPYIDSNQSLAVKIGSDIKTKDDLGGKIIGVQIGTTGEETAKEINKEIGFKEIKTYDDTLLAFEDLKAGRIDAIINDYPVSMYLSKDEPELDVIETIETNEKYGIAFAQDNDDLREAINKVLAEMKNDGTYDVIYEEWFGETEP